MSNDHRDERAAARMALMPGNLQTEYRGYTILYNPNREKIGGRPYTAEGPDQEFTSSSVDGIISAIDAHLSKSRTLTPFKAYIIDRMDVATVSVNSIGPEFDCVNTTIKRYEGMTGPIAAVAAERHRVERSEMGRETFMHTSLKALFEHTGENRTVLLNIAEAQRQIRTLENRIRDLRNKLKRVHWDAVEAARIAPKPKKTSKKKRSGRKKK